MRRTVLVTGSNGFLGRHIVAALRAADDVEILHGLGVTRPVEGVPPGRTVPIDIRSGWPRGLAGIDDVVHLAWWGLDDFRSGTHRDQGALHSRFLDGAMAAGVNRIIGLGTCLEYGLVEGELSEQLAPRPIVPYAAAKAAVGDGLLESADRYGTQVLWARLFYPFGPGQAPRSLWSSVERAIEENRDSIDMSPGDQLRDFIPVESVAALVGGLLTNPRWETPIVNLCSGRPTSVKDLVATWIASRGSGLRMNLGALPYPDYEPFAFWGSRLRLELSIARASRTRASSDPSTGMETLG